LSRIVQNSLQSSVAYSQVPLQSGATSFENKFEKKSFNNAAAKQMSAQNVATLTPGAQRLTPATWEPGQQRTIVPQNKIRLPLVTNVQTLVKKEESHTTGATRFVDGSKYTKPSIFVECLDVANFKMRLKI
jgi:hypothetical protein